MILLVLSMTLLTLTGSTTMLLDLSSFVLPPRTPFIRTPKMLLLLLLPLLPPLYRNPLLRPDRSVGVHVVRCERLDGDGKSLALSRVAGRWVPVSRAHHHGSHVAQVFRVEGHFLGEGECYA